MECDAKRIHAPHKGMKCNARGPYYELGGKFYCSYHFNDEAVEEIDTLRVELARLREVVGMVEWEWTLFGNSGHYSCPWCHKPKTVGHAPDCPRQSVIDGEGK